MDDVQPSSLSHFAAMRFPGNAPGPFYGTISGCLACGAPEVEAPTLLAPLDGENYDTYFVRQPETPEEIEAACRALEVCCTSSLRYGGTDPAIIVRLGNDPVYCDYVLPQMLNQLPRRWWQIWRRR